MAVVFSKPTGTAVGFQVVNGSPASIISITAKKVGVNPQAQLSNWASRLGGVPNGPPGSLTQYLSGLGIVTGLAGSFRDSISTRDGAAIVANVNGVTHTLNVTGIAFQRVERPSGGDGSCTVEYGHGLEGVLAYFQDNRLSNSANAGRYTVVKIGGTKLDCAVVGVSFQLLNSQYNLWSWTLDMLVAPNIQAGAAST
jgi:hypothetical protein